MEISSGQGRALKAVVSLWRGCGLSPMANDITELHNRAHGHTTVLQRYQKRRHAGIRKLTLTAMKAVDAPQRKKKNMFLMFVICF